MEDIKKILKKYFTIIVLILILLGLLSNKDHLNGIFSFWFKILTPIFYGIFIAYILSPLELKLKNHFHFKKESRNKALSILITYIVFLSIIILLGFLCLPQIINSISELITQVPLLYNNFIKFISQYENKTNIDFLTKNSTTIDTLIQGITTSLSTILPNMLNGLTNMFKTSFNLCMSIVISVYLMFEKENIKKNIKRFCLAYFKEQKTNKLKEIYIDCEYIMSKFIMGKLIDSIIIGFLCSIIMIILQLDYVVLISVLVGITNMIPYIGPFIGGAIGVVLLFIVSPKSAFIFLIVVISLQQFDGCILGPKILGGKIGIKPLWILVSLIIGGALGGLVGMFLGTPIISMIIYLLNKDIEKRLMQESIKSD